VGEAKTAKPQLSGGFWNRAFGVFFDWLLIGLAVTGVAVAAYPATNGAVRMASPPVKFTACAPSEVPAGFDPAKPMAGVDPALQATIIGDPAKFRPNQVSECVVSLFGHELNRTRHIAQVWQEGATTRSIYFDVPVDRSGAVASEVVYLDNALGPAMLVLLALTEALFGFSVGKMLTGLRVRRRADDSRRAGFGAILLRNLLIYGPYAAFSLFSLALASEWIPAGLPSTIGGAVLMVIMLGWLLALVVGLVRGRPDPFWDVWSGTRVVRR